MQYVSFAPVVVIVVTSGYCPYANLKTAPGSAALLSRSKVRERKKGGEKEESINEVEGGKERVPRWDPN